MIQISEAIRRLKALKGKLERPVEFFRSNLLGWRELARSVARQVMLQNPPAGVPPDEWNATVDYVADQIGTQMLTSDAVGMLIFLGERRGLFSVSEFSAGLEKLWSGELELRDIADYVRAGRRGDPLGKPDIDERDANRTPEQTAMNIMEAIRKGKTQRDDSIRKFLTGRNTDAAEKLLPAIKQAWVETFSVVAHDQFKRYVERVVRAV